MPFGLQVIGRLRRDDELLRAALALERMFTRPLPDMKRLESARPELKSIVTHPPDFAGRATGTDARVAV
jgi:hypothetical protein